MESAISRKGQLIRGSSSDVYTTKHSIATRSNGVDVY